MTGWEMVAIAAAGFTAGGINAVVGSGTLVAFPVLLAVGLPPGTATVSNSLGLVPGNLTGAFLLLHLPAASFEAVSRRSRRRTATSTTARPIRTGTAGRLAALFAGAAYVVVATDGIDWRASALIAVGAILGGYTGARFGRRLPSAVPRTAIVLLGRVAIAVLLTR
jgi:hypothetical protein